MRIWDSFYVTVGPHTFKVYSHEGRNTMKKKKLLSYILSTSLLISLTSNPVLAMTGGANIDQEITSVQENQDNNSNQNEKDQESDSKDISDSKDQKDEPSSGTDKEEDSDSGDKSSGGSLSC